MNIHEEFALDVLGGKAAEAIGEAPVSMRRISLAMVQINLLDLVEDNAARLVDAEEAHTGSDQRKQAEQPPVGTGQLGDVIVLDALRGVIAGLGLLLILGARRRFGASAVRRGLLLKQRLFRAHGECAVVCSELI